MRVIVTHMRPDLDAVGAVWSIKRFLPNWEKAKIQFVPAGERIGKLKVTLRQTQGDAEQSRSIKSEKLKVIEKIGNNEVIHVDTGLGPLDHHQTDDENTCAAKRAWQWVMAQRGEGESKAEKQAGDRLMEMICQIDHFKEVFWPDPQSDRYDITVARILDGLKLIEKEDDQKIIDFGIFCLDSLHRAFENKVWAEGELSQKGITFETRWGKGIGVATFNDDVIHLAQRMGYRVAVRKDPKKNYVRIKASPARSQKPESRSKSIDLTPAYEELKKRDPDATWFLHVSKRMLLNGTTKNPKMKPTKLTLAEIIEVLKNV